VTCRPHSEPLSQTNPGGSGPHHRPRCLALPLEAVHHPGPWIGLVNLSRTTSSDVLWPPAATRGGSHRLLRSLVELWDRPAATPPTGWVPNLATPQVRGPRGAGRSSDLPHWIKRTRVPTPPVYLNGADLSSREFSRSAAVAARHKRSCPPQPAPVASAQAAPLDERHVPASLRQGGGKLSASPAGSDLNRIIGSGSWHPHVLLVAIVS
jgi:hypothetical protein